jgi:hypothetical protein
VRCAPQAGNWLDRSAPDTLNGSSHKLRAGAVDPEPPSSEKLESRHSTRLQVQRQGLPVRSIQSMGFTKSMFIHATAGSIAAPKQKQ